MADTVKVEGVLEKGYGLSPKIVMQDTNLTIEAKAIYAYMTSFAGNGENAFPSVSRACKDLNISEKRFRRHRDQLIDNGYITIQKSKNNKGKFGNNIYVINHTVKTTVRTNCHDGVSPARQNDSTNNNMSFNNNSSLIGVGDSAGAQEIDPIIFYQENFGVMSPFIQQSILHWCNDLSDELVVEAMKIALKAGKRFNYAEGILKGWIQRNIKTLEDTEAEAVEFKGNISSKKQKKSDEDVQSLLDKYRE